jgi:hypothetical protein
MLSAPIREKPSIRFNSRSRSFGCVHVAI